MMEDFIPHVRFYEISGPDFLDDVLPLNVLPKKLKWELIKFYIDPSRKPKSGVLPARCPASVLIKPEQKRLLQDWINDRKEKTEWKLLYRASRDGYTAHAFHSCCDNKGPTLTIVKCKDKTGLIGGYTPLNWSSDTGYYVADQRAQSF